MHPWSPPPSFSQRTQKEGHAASPRMKNSNLQYHRHDQRSLLCLLGDVALQIAADFFFDHAVVGFLFFTRLFQGLHPDLSRTVHKAIFASSKASSDYLR